jgi:protein-disulfide isomerase
MSMDWIVRAKYGILVLVLSGIAATGWAQTPTPSSPATAAAEQAVQPQAPAPLAPTPQAAVVSPFPKPELKNFTADSPTTAVVNEFLTAMWGSAETRIWSVQAILKTAAPGVVKVVVFAADKTQPKNIEPYAFFITPDGKHAIADTMMDFGAKPFAERRKLLEDRADGPAEGAAGKGLLIVEFGDLLSGKSKEVHEKAAELAKEFPEARWVYESLPVEGHLYSFRAAAESLCVRKAKGDAGFFTYAQTIFDKHEGLTATTIDAAFAAAATAAGADPKAVTACAGTQAIKDEVKASVALAADADINEAPALVVNGHILPLGTTTYETLKGILVFQAKQDGIAVTAQPTLSTLK